MYRRQKIWKTVGLHALLWAIYIAWEVTSVILLHVHARPIQYIDFYIFNISFFYLNSEFILKIPERYGWGWLLLMLPVELFAYCVISILIGRLFDPAKFDLYHFASASRRGMNFFLISVGYRFLKHKIAVERDLARTQTALLESQINPHFLFNSLNYLYNSVYKVSPEAAQGLLLLADIMRYSLRDVGPDGKVPLAEEIAHIRNYMKLTQSRFDNALHITTSMPGPEDCPNITVPPLLVLTFIENVLKHGDLTDPAEPAEIVIGCTATTITLRTSNLKRLHKDYQTSYGGIRNARTRLDLYYKKNFDLKINDIGKYFIVDLTIFV